MDTNDLTPWSLGDVYLKHAFGHSYIKASMANSADSTRSTIRVTLINNLGLGLVGLLTLEFQMTKFTYNRI